VAETLAFRAAKPRTARPVLVAGDIWPLFAAEMLVEGLVVQEGRPRGEPAARRVRRTHSQPFRRSVRRCSNFSSPHLLMVTAA
jgi:hypothetical protein